MKTKTGYEQKLEAIYEEVSTVRLGDYPKDLLKSLEKEARADYRQYLKDSGARFSKYTRSFDWQHDVLDGGEAERQLQNRLIAERFTAEEKAEYVADQIAESVGYSERILAALRVSLYNNNRKIKEAVLRDKPKMLEHYTGLKAAIEARIGFAERELAELKEEPQS